MGIVVRRKELEQILSYYRVGTLKGYQIPRQGLLNRIVFIKTTRGKYVLKIALANSPTLHYELGLLNHIRMRTALRVLLTREKHLFAPYGTYKAFLSPHISGKHPKKISAKMLREVGKFLGEFHNRAKDFHATAGRSQILSISQTSIKKVLGRALRVHTQRAREAAHYISKAIWKYPLSKKLPQGPIHVDVKPENSLFLGEKLMGVVDFDNAYRGPLVLDLGVAMAWYGISHGKFDMERLRILYRAYNARRKLSRIEKEYLYNVFHFAILRNALRAVEFLSRRKLPTRWVHQFLDTYLGAERNFLLSKDEFMLRLEHK